MNEPKLRFKADDGSDFPEWEEKKLGEVGDIMTGNTPSTKQEDYYGGCYLWVTPTDITDSREVSVTAKKLTELGYTVARHIPANSVLVTCIASIGKNAIIRENGSCNQQINSITPYNDYSVEFVYYLICQNERLLHANAGAGGMEILNKDSFSKIKMYFPCLAEQQKIAEFLSTIDTVIEKQKETVSAWEERKKGVMQKLFSQEVRFKADDGSNFPEWEEKKLGDVCEYRKGQSVGVNYVGTENMNQNFSGVDSLDSTNEVKGVTYCVGDTLMSNIRPYLKKTWKADRNGVCSTDVLVFRPVNVDSDFLYYNISSEKFVLYVMTGVKGSKMPRGDKGHIMEYDMLTPCLAEQQKIADCLSSLDEVIEKQKATLSAWEELKKGLLQQMFV